MKFVERNTRTVSSSLNPALLALAAALGVMTWAFAPTPGLAQFEDGRMRARIGLSASGAFFGDAQAWLNRGIDRTDQLDPAWGGAAYLEVPLLSFLSLTGEFAAHAWNTQAAGAFNIDRHVFMDLSVAPRLRLTLGGGPGQAQHVVLFVDVPVGFTLNAMNNGYANAVALPGGEIGVGYGLHVGGRAGAQFVITDGFGLTLDAGFLARAVRQPLDTTSVATDLDLTTTQLTARVGVIFVL